MKKDEKIHETFSPNYNEVEQVKKCVGFLLNEKVVEARIALVIGFNGRNFVTSTDWRIRTENGHERIMPFSIHPQYPNFIECLAGVEYSVYDDSFRVLPDAPLFAKDAVVKIGGKSYRFVPGQPLIVYVDFGERFIATDCRVKIIEQQYTRIFRVITDNKTQYGLFNEKGTAFRE